MEAVVTTYEYCATCNSHRLHTSGKCNNCHKIPSWVTIGERYMRSEQPDKSHYRHTTIDPCQYVEAMGTAEFRGACVLNILKYLTRYPYKGTPLMDLAKAQDYLTMLIEHEKKKATASTQEEDKRR